MGHGGQKLDLLCILNRLFVVLINLFYQLGFLFQLVEKGLFYASVVLLFFVGCYFLSIVNMGLVEKLMFQVDQLHSDYFDNLNKVGSVVDCLSVIIQRQFLLHICILVGVMFRFLQGRILYFWVFQLWFYV